MPLFVMVSTLEALAWAAYALSAAVAWNHWQRAYGAGEHLAYISGIPRPKFRGRLHLLMLCCFIPLALRLCVSRYDHRADFAFLPAFAAIVARYVASSCVHIFPFQSQRGASNFGPFCALRALKYVWPKPFFRFWF